MRKQRGFTIVELLIVIVVIGVLAAIIIISYIGITNSATNSQLQANATEVAQKLATYKIQTSTSESYPAGTNNSGSIPATQAAAGIPSNINITVYLTDSANKNYCTTITSGATSYSVSSTSGASMPGTCVTNIVSNPSFETTGFSETSHVTISRPAGAAFDGSYFGMVNNSGDGGDYYATVTGIAVSPNTSYTASLYVKGSGTVAEYGTSAFQEAGGGYRAYGTIIASGFVTPNAWTRKYVSATTPSDAGVNARIVMRPGQNSGEVLSYDALMVTQGSTLWSYGDGDSRGWFWSNPSQPNASTSIGPAVAQ